jgi:hypothetical protein
MLRFSTSMPLLLRRPETKPFRSIEFDVPSSSIFTKRKYCGWTISMSYFSLGARPGKGEGGAARLRCDPQLRLCRRCIACREEIGASSFSTVPHAWYFFHSASRLVLRGDGLRYRQPLENRRELSEKVGHHDVIATAHVVLLPKGHVLSVLYKA